MSHLHPRPQPAARACAIPLVAVRGGWCALRVVCVVVLALAAAVVAANARDVQKIRVACPLCDDVFSSRLVIEEMRTGLRLDFKQYGCTHAPAELPECPKCGFVLPDGGRSEFTDAEAGRLRELLKSDRFLSAREETSYFRLAIELETLSRPPQDVAFAYVAASWQVDDAPIRCQIYLARALVWYDTYLAHPEPGSPARVRAMLLKAEILRRLGRFEEAKDYLSELAFHPAMARPGEQNIIQQQRDLVAAGDDEPHVAIADDAKVEVSLRVTSPGARSLRPELTHDARLPAFPSGPYAARVSGAVTLVMDVTRSGYVVSCQVKSATAEAFAKSVLRSARDWTFDPDRLDGAPSPVQLECTVYFALEG